MTSKVLDIRPAAETRDLAKLFGLDRLADYREPLSCRWTRDADGKLACRWQTS